MRGGLRVDVLCSVEADEGGQDRQANDEAPSHIASGLTYHQISHPEAEEDADGDEQLVERSCGTAHGSR